MSIENDQWSDTGDIERKKHIYLPQTRESVRLSEGAFDPDLLSKYVARRLNLPGNEKQRVYIASISPDLRSVELVLEGTFLDEDKIKLVAELGMCILRNGIDSTGEIPAEIDVVR